MYVEARETMTNQAVYILRAERVTDEQYAVVLDGVWDALAGGVGPPVEVRALGVWREPGYRRGERLIAHQSVDAIVHAGVIAAVGVLTESTVVGVQRYPELYVAFRDGQLDAEAMLAYMERDPWRESGARVDVVVVSACLYAGSPQARGVDVLTRAGVGAVLSSGSGVAESLRRVALVMEADAA
ncbi:MAG: hypothetical protein DCC58_12015 [Chloroflexi bacterium]|nr:MAG: hypothetical protein DCC58_12015 [Chloroflexota bacterium]